MDLSDKLWGWRGSAADLVTLLADTVATYGLPGEPPDVRAIRYWRSIGVLGRSEGRRFGEREVLEALAVLVLRSRSMKLEGIRAQLEQTEIEGLRSLITSASSSRETVPGVSERADRATVLLAQGVFRLYESVSAGAILRQDDRIVPEELLDAMCGLGRLYLEQGDEDRAASVHDVVERCRLPLREWDLEVFGHQDFVYADALLVDPDLRVPTAECEEIARKHGGIGADQVIEDRLHENLRSALKGLGGEAERAYTAVRLFLGRHSLATLDELYGYCDEEGLPAKLSRLLGESFYQKVHEAWLINGRANRCAHCGTLMRPHPNTDRYNDGVCPLVACRSVNPPEVADKLSPEEEEVVVCNSQILKYWVDPAIDELRIYDAARNAGVQAELYPHKDRCDVSLQGEIGVDVKSYRSPVTLALKLNRGIGGLEHYDSDKRILAVPDYIARRSKYKQILRDALDTSGTRSLKVKSVSEVLDLIGEMAHA